MSPVLLDGDLLLVQSVDPQNLSLGDIIVYPFHDQYRVHRFMYSRGQKDRMMIVTKADNSFRMDLPFEARLLIGKVVRITRGASKRNAEAVLWKLGNALLAAASLTVGFIFIALRKVKRTLKQIFPPRHSHG